MEGRSDDRELKEVGGSTSRHETCNGVNGPRPDGWFGCPLSLAPGAEYLAWPGLNLFCALYSYEQSIATELNGVR